MPQTYRGRPVFWDDEPPTAAPTALPRATTYRGRPVFWDEEIGAKPPPVEPVAGAAPAPPVELHIPSLAEAPAPLPRLVPTGGGLTPAPPFGDYDYRSAAAAGLTAGETEHWPSRVPSGPNEGLILKSPAHPTFFKTIEADRAIGFNLFQKGGRLFSFKGEPPSGDFVRLSDQEVAGLLGQAPPTFPSPGPLAGLFGEPVPGVRPQAPQAPSGPSALARGFATGGRETIGMLAGAGETSLRLLDDLAEWRLRRGAEIERGRGDEARAGVLETTAEQHSMLDAAADWLGKQRRDWMEEAQKAGGAPPKGWQEWLLFNLGRTTPMIAGAVASGLAGGVPGMLAFGWVLGEEEARGALEQVGIGPDATVRISGLGVELSGSQLAAATGVPITIIELAGGPERFLRKVLGGAGTSAGRIMLASLFSAVLEAPEEVAQNYVSAVTAQVAARKPLDEDFWRETARSGLEQGAAILPAAVMFGGLGGAAVVGQRARAPAKAPQVTEIGPPPIPPAVTAPDAPAPPLRAATGERLTAPSAALPPPPGAPQVRAEAPKPALLPPGPPAPATAPPRPAQPPAAVQPAPATSDFEAQLRETRFTASPAVRGADDHSYRIKREDGGYIAMRMPIARGEPPRYFRPPEGVAWTEDQAVDRVREEIAKAQPAVAPDVSRGAPSGVETQYEPEIVQRVPPTTRPSEPAILPGMPRGIPEAVAPPSPSQGDQEAEISVLRPPAAQLPTTAIIAREPIAATDFETGFAVVPRTGQRIQVRHAIVEADDLVASLTDDETINPAYPQDLQPRDRTRAPSRQQIASIAQAPDPALLDKSVKVTDGAPVISTDGVVESGNARVLGLRRAYRQGTVDTYRDYLAAQGYPVEGVKQPVLVRIRDQEMTPEERQAFARDANARDTLGMSATEQAMADAKAMPDAMLDDYRGGEVDLAANRGFVRRFLQVVVPETEQAGMIAADGAMSQEAKRRIEGALLAKAYGDAALIGELVEAADTNIRAIGGAMLDTAGQWAVMRAATRDGRIAPDMDQTAALVEAAKLVSRARREGRGIAELIGQRDIFSGQAVDPMTEMFLGLMFRDTRQWTKPLGREKMTSVLGFYAVEAGKTTPGVDLLGQPAASPQAILGAARQRLERQYGEGQAAQAAQAGLFTERIAPVSDRGEALRQAGRRGAEQDVSVAAPPRGEEAARAGEEGARAAESIEAIPREEYADRAHYDLAQYGARLAAGGKSEAETGQRLFDKFNGFVEGVRASEDIDSLARDYYDEIVDMGIAGTLIDPDEATRYAVKNKDYNPRSFSRIAAGIRPSLVGAVEPGARYREPGTAEQRELAPREEQPEKLVTREDIVRQLTSNLGMPIYERRVKGEIVTGFYRSPQREIRVKKGATDLESTAHEVAHFIDDTSPDIRRALWWPASPDKAIYREELAAVSYNKNSVKEGWAEFVRLWATQPEEARARAPNVFAWWETHLLSAEPEFAKAMRNMQLGMATWFQQDPASRARSKIDPQIAPARNAALNSLWAQFRTSAADAFDPIRNMELTLRGQVAPAGPFQLAHMTRTIANTVEAVINYGTPVLQSDGSFRYEDKGLLDTLAPVADVLDDYLGYAVGLRARHLRAEGRENLFTDAEIKGLIALGGTEGGNQRQLFDSVVADYQAYNQRLLDFAESMGIIDPEARAKWEATVYIPFYRVLTQAGRLGWRRGRPGEFTGIRRLTGGTGELRSVLDNIVQNTTMLLNAAIKNEAISAVARLAEEPGGARFMVRIPPTARKVVVATASVKQGMLDAWQRGMERSARQAERDVERGEKEIDEALAEAEAEQERYERFEESWLTLFDEEMPSFLQAWQLNQSPGGQNILTRMVNGKPVYYEVADPLLMRSFVAMGPRMRSWARRWLINMPRRVFQTTVTLSATFMTKNIVKDTAAATMYSRYGFRPGLESARGLKSIMTEDQDFKDWMLNGDGLMGIGLYGEDIIRADLDMFYRGKGIDPAMVLNSPRKIWQAMNRLALAFENATRLGESKRGERTGDTARARAYASLEVSTNFMARGDSEALSWFLDATPFLSAAIQGLDRAYRGFATDTHRLHVGISAATLAAASAALYAWNQALWDDDDPNDLYNSLPPWQRDAFWHFYVPQKYLGGTEGEYLHFRLPKIWEPGVIASLAERTTELALHDPDKGEWTRAVLAMLYNMMNIGGVPQFAAPIFDIARNKRFPGTPIETEAMEKLPPSARAGVGTSRTLRWLGEQTSTWPRWAQLSPAKTEALLRGYFSGWAAMGLTITDHMLFDDMPEMRLDQFPIMRAFYSQQPARTTKYTQEFYRLAKEFTELRNAARQMRRNYRSQRAAEIEERHETRLAKGVERIKAGLSGLRRMMVAVSEAPDAKTLEGIDRSWRRQRGSIKGMSRALDTAGAGDDLARWKSLLIDDMSIAREFSSARAVTEIRERLRAMDKSSAKR